jgi:uncharacterized RDD family membrane protein YckC/type II secretory pathway pseudopilin PulG
MPEEKKLYAPATILRRLSNHILDAIFQVIINAVIASFISAAIFQGQPHLAWSMLTSLVIYIAYYAICEALWQKTPAKFITQTKVVMRDGSKPPFLNILGRSFSRIIPFEAFSFLFGAYPIGWHDRFSGTIVVPSNYTADDVKKIDYASLKAVKGSGWVTVIIIFFIILVAIAIIGILSSVVLVSLNSARGKGQDARVRESLMSIRVSAEVYNGNNNNSYSKATDCSTGMFTDSSIQKNLASIKTSNPICYAEGNTYAVSASLISRSFSDPIVNFCVDSTGFANSGVAQDNGKTASCVNDALNSSANSSQTESNSNTVVATSSEKLTSKFNAPVGSFSIAFPYQPTYKKDSQPIGQYGNITYNIYQYSTDNILLQASYIEYPSGIDLSTKVDEALTGSMNGGVKALGGSLVSSSLGYYMGNRSIDYLAFVSKANVYYKGRNIMKGQSLYGIAGIYMGDASKDQNSKATDDFFASLEIH